MIPGETLTITAEVQTDGNLADGTVLFNQVIVASDALELDPLDNTSDEETTVIQQCQDIVINYDDASIEHGSQLQDGPFTARTGLQTYLNSIDPNTAITLSGVTFNPNHPDTVVAFDSDLPESQIGEDTDLSVDKGILLTLPEFVVDANMDDLVDEVDDSSKGGTQTFEFVPPRNIATVLMVDIESKETGVIEAFNEDGLLIKKVTIPTTGNKGSAVVTINAPNVSKLVITYNSSGASGEITSPCDMPGFAGLIRDFHGRNSQASEPFSPFNRHPDFQQNTIQVDLGIVGQTLGGDGDPVFTGPTPTTSNALNFDQWFDNVPTDGGGNTINLCKEFGIALAPNNGEFEFVDPTFFPIDNELFGNEGFTDGQGNSHNYHFTVEFVGTFETLSGDTPTVELRGDDDMWLYVDEQLVYDGGGVHPPLASGIISLTGLDPGIHDIKLYFAERHTVQSDFEITTSFEVTPAELDCSTA